MNYDTSKDNCACNNVSFRFLEKMFHLVKLDARCGVVSFLSSLSFAPSNLLF
jgi:hypothetical protein